MSDLGISSTEGTTGSGGPAPATVSGSDNGTGSGVAVDTKASGTSSASSSDGDWESILGRLGEAPEDVIQKILEARPEVAKLATKNVRKTEIQRQAEALAEEFYKQRSGQTTDEFNRVKRERDELVARQRESLLSTMSDSEQEAYKLKEALSTRDSELNYYRTVFAQREEQEAKDQIIATAREDWGFDDDDVKKLQDANSIDRFVNTALRLSGEKRKKMAEDTKTLAEKVEALSRVVGGTSVHAATANASSGGDMAFADLEQGYLDGNVTYERYMEARGKSLKR